MEKTYLYSFAVLLAVSSLISCKSNKNGTSEKTGLAYNKKENGGFQVNNKFKRGPGPGLVEIEGGVFVMSGSAINIPGEELGNYNHKRETTVSSFYMDETEVSNTNWLEYLDWIRRTDPTNYEYYYNELPDTLVWRRPLSYNEPYVDNYLRHPAYQDYPVVGVSWEQAQRYCAWRTDIVNESLLREQGYMASYKTVNGDGKNTKKANTPATPRPDGPFTTDLYLNGQYDDKGPRAMKDLSPSATTAANGAAKGPKGGPTRNVRLEDGILKQPYRLPTEAEWEYAALGLIGNTEYENISSNKIYPWDGLGISSAKSKTRGLILANFKRTKGDYMGVGGSLNDKGGITVAVRAYVPNDFGLYNMAGNVNEWVADVYRANTFNAADALNPYRGNYYQDKKVADPATGKLEKDKYNRPVMTAAVSGKKQTWAEKQSAVDASANTYADQRGYRDEANMDLYGEITLVTNKSRVYKGGSWDDQALWLNPASRRFLQQDESSADIGFRCAMTMLGASEIQSFGKPQFKPKQQKPFNAKKS